MRVSETFRMLRFPTSLSVAFIGASNVRVRLKDIAAKVGFSVTTVSRALGGYDDVAEETRRLIVQTAEEMGYRPNVVARRLQKQRSDTLGFVIPTFGPRFSDPYFSELLAGIGNEAASHDYDLLVSTQPPDTPEEAQAYERLVRERRADGVLVTRTRINDARIAYLLEQGFPFVAFGRTQLDGAFPCVDVDGELGVFNATRHLIELGHRDIAIILPPADLMFTVYRYAGFFRAMEMHGLTVEETWKENGDLTERGGYAVASRLLEGSRWPTAILACNDLMAMGAMQAAREQGLRVGSDLSVVGFDDIPLAEHAHPSLTTVCQPIYEIGRRVCHMLIQVLSGESLDASEFQVLFEPQLVIRDSTGPPSG
jgi:LacI family transcriptional regulator